MSAIPLPQPVADAFRRQEDACRTLGSPFNAVLCGLVANDGLPAGTVHDRLADWNGVLDHGGDALPLRLTGALHFLVLSGRDDALAAVYPPNDATPDGIAEAVNGAVVHHGDFIDRFLDSPPQTNETGRSAILLPAFLRLQERFGLPFILSELGSSAGLNQNWHHYRYEYGKWGWGDLNSPVTIACEWHGDELPPTQPGVAIADSAGCDIAPIPIDTEEHRLRLKSYVWPDQPARLGRLAGALAIAAENPPSVAFATAGNWLAERLEAARPGHLHVVFHTIMWQYIPAEEQAHAQALIEGAGRKAAADAPIAWLRFEADETKGSAGLVLTTWDGSEPDGQTVPLGRGDFHGRWIDWSPQA